MLQDHKKSQLQGRAGRDDTSPEGGPPMTAKEKREMKRLQNRIDELERVHQRDMEVWRENAMELIDMRTALKNIHDAMVDAVIEANKVIQPSIDRVDARLKPMSQHTFENAADWDKNPQF